ncbi:MAG TPA: GDSL-type esterase/lipase family protein [Verrucomicrobiae bacterium]|nr:GDSL-type esterase/lipase family protein [Verrucomicrobiae bacterium]
MHSWLKYLLMYAALCATALAQSLVVTNKADGKVWVEAKGAAGVSHTLQVSADLHFWTDLNSSITDAYSIELTNNWGATKYFRLLPTGPDPDPIRVAIIGDSLSSDCCGWGGGIHSYFKPAATVVNYALPWTSTKVFLQSAEYDKLTLIKPNYVLIQFGWFDGSGDPDRSATPSEFAANLRTIVDVVRGFNGVPILVTVHAARNWDGNGNLIPSDHPYNAITKQVAAEVNTPVIDLYKLTSELFGKMGKSGCEFMIFAPFGPDDTMHFSYLGGVYVSQTIVNALPDALAPYLIGNLERPPLP